MKISKEDLRKYIIDCKNCSLEEAVEIKSLLESVKEVIYGGTGFGRNKFYYTTNPYFGFGRGDKWVGMGSDLSSFPNHKVVSGNEFLKLLKGEDKMVTKLYKKGDRVRLATLEEAKKIEDFKWYSVGIPRGWGFNVDRINEMFGAIVTIKDCGSTSYGVEESTFRILPNQIVGLAHMTKEEWISELLKGKVGALGNLDNEYCRYNKELGTFENSRGNGWRKFDINLLVTFEDYIIVEDYEEAVEMTMEEICKALGKKVKIVKG